MAEMTFITNHTAVLLNIARNPRITAREIAAGTAISERAIRKIIADLNRGHFISKKREGRHVFYTIYTDNNLPDFSAQEISVGRLLQALGWQDAMARREAPVLVGAGSAAPFQLYKTNEREEKSIDNLYAQLF
jgi:hypothetical protein